MFDISSRGRERAAGKTRQTGRRARQGRPVRMKAHRLCTVLLAAVAVAFMFWDARKAEAGEPAKSEKATQFPTTYELFSIPQTRWPGFSDMVVDDGGLLWIMANNKVFYWTGREFREPVSGPMSSGYYLAGLYGGPDRGAYATQKGKAEHEGLLYRLSDGAAKLEGTFYFEVSHERPGLYVSRSGRIFNWGNRFLASRIKGQWKRIEVRMSLRQTLVFDLGEEVYFYYDNSLYCADGTGQLQEHDCPQWVAARPGQDRIVGVVWAGRRALLLNYGKSGLLAFDLPTGRKISLFSALSEFKTTRFYDAFPLSNGDVWLLGRTRREPGYVFFRLSSDGTLIQISATRAMPWDNTRVWQFPDSVLETSDGEIVFGLPKEGLAVYRAGDLSVWGWQYGFTQGIRHLHEGPGGSIWFPLEGQIAKMRLGDGPPQLSPLAGDWEEFPLVSRGGLWQLNPGELATFRQDHPGALSRWDGREWEHQEMPFDTGTMGARSAVDDRGHLLLTPQAGPDGYFDVGPDAAERFHSIQALLESAAVDGARDFRVSADGFQGIVVTPDGRIWFGYHNYNAVYMFDGERWDQFRFSDDVDYLQASPKYGVLFKTQGRRFYRYERGQMIEVAPSLPERRELMINDKGFWPYERELVEEHPDSYFPVLQQGSKRTLFFRPDEFESASRRGGVPKGAAAIELPHYAECVRPAPSGGAWLFTAQGSGSPLRIFGETMRRIDLSKTPLAERYVGAVLEDGAGDLWFRSGRAAVRSGYRHKLSRMYFSTADRPRVTERELRLQFSLLPSHMAEGVRLFQRMDGDTWQPLEQGQRQCIFRFPVSGGYRCDVTGLKLGGRIREDISLHVRARVELPETVLAGPVEHPLLVEDLEWDVPVAIHKTREEVSADLLWAVDGGAWRETPADGLLSLMDMEPGRHSFRFAAREEGFWRDQTPVELAIDYRPDYNKYVSRWIPELLSLEPASREKARKKLIAAGERAVPALKEQLVEARKAVRLIPELEPILRELGEESRPRRLPPYKK